MRPTHRQVDRGQCWESWEFEEFVLGVRPRLLRAFAGWRGDAAGVAVAEALAYAWEHWERMRTLENPAGYLFRLLRVGRRRTRPRRAPRLPPPAEVGVPEIEPSLLPALLALPEPQRTAVWLVHACQWHYNEVAEALGTSRSMVGDHVRRGLARLRQQLEVDVRA